MCAAVTNRALAASVRSEAAALASIDAALAKCADGMRGLEARQKTHLPGYARLREHHAALSHQRRELAATVP